MNAVLAADWPEMAATAVRQISDTTERERYAEPKSAGFRTGVHFWLVVNSIPTAKMAAESKPAFKSKPATRSRRHGRFYLWLVRVVANFVETRLIRLSDELVTRAGFLARLQPNAIEILLSNSRENAQALMVTISEFERKNRVVIKHCEQNAALLRSAHARSRVAAAFDRLGASAKLLGESVEYFVPLLRELIEDYEQTGGHLEVQDSLDSKLMNIREEWEFDPEFTRLANAALVRMKTSNSQGNAS